MVARLAERGALRQAWYVTEASANDFPRLPVREGEYVLVGLAVFSGGVEFERFQRRGRRPAEVAPALSTWLSKPPQVHRLVPTARSAVHA
jgi:hypothetical protein